MRETVAIVGLGLMGGSLAKRIKVFKPNTTIIGYDSEKDVILSAIDSKVIDAGFMAINQEIKRAKYIIIAVPPLLFPVIVRQITEMELHPQVVITDLLSVKGCCEEWIKHSNLRKSYVGGHPICGHEGSGFIHSHSSYFDQGYYCLMTPNEENDLAYIQLKQLIGSLHIEHLTISPKEHDELMAYVSHMPHAISYMMSQLTLKKSGIKTMGKSFKEMTRISKSSAGLWTEIFMLNQDPLVHALTEMKDEIDVMLKLIKKENPKDLFSYLEASQAMRISKELEEVC